MKTLFALATLFLCSLQPLWASTTLWFCTAKDSDNKLWQASGAYELPVITAAIAACKQQSRMPRSCKCHRENCESFIDGVATRPLWQCMALDAAANYWKNEPMLDRDAAALSAKQLCRSHSPLPNSCSINMISCINERAAYESINRN